MAAFLSVSAFASSPSLGLPSETLHKPRTKLNALHYSCSVSLFNEPRKFLSTPLVGSSDGRVNPLVLHAASSSNATGVEFSKEENLTKEEVDGLVDQLLKTVDGYDGGASMDSELKAKVIQYVETLEKYGMDEPLKSPLVFGEWEVVFVSSPTAAGGGYRSAIGRALLRTKDLVQTISPPNSVGNKVAFDALGFIPGEVTLKGTFEALDEKRIRVTFDPPNLAIASAKFTYAKTSQVQLSVTYLDDKIRIGRGSRGSVFVFKRR